MFSSQVFHERLSRLCKAKGTNITNFAKDVLKASSSAPSNWKKGSVPGCDILYNSAVFMDVSADYLLGLEDIPNHRQILFSEDEMHLIEALRATEPQTKRVILAAVYAALKATVEETAENEPEEDENLSQTVRRAPEGIVAAGAVLFDKPIDEEKIEIPAKYGDKTRYYVLKVRGDSMEPRIPNGAYLVVGKEDQPLNGQIGVVGIEGDGSDFEYAVKEVHYRQQTKEIELHSFNEAYDVKIYPLSRVKSVERVEQVILPR